MSSLRDIQKRTCMGICKKFQVKKPTLGSRYGSGQGHCQTCDTWIDHNGCHMIDGSDAKENSVGWFCNCCNVRVRQKPRNKKYKEKLRSEKSNLEIVKDDTDEELGDSTYDEITAENLDISKKQATLLKEISIVMPNKDEDLDILEIITNIKDHIRFEIKDNWGSWAKFFEFARDYEELNPISAIIIFEKLNQNIGRVATRQEFLDIVNIDEKWIDAKFKSWEHLLELLGHDPWYRNNSKKELVKLPKKIILDKNRLTETSNNEEIESIEEIIQKTNELKIKLLTHYKEKDSEKSVTDYSYVEMFELLEKYIKIIPNDTKYLDVKNFFWS